MTPNLFFQFLNYYVGEAKLHQSWYSLDDAQTHQDTERKAEAIEEIDKSAAKEKPAAVSAEGESVGRIRVGGPIHLRV